MHLACNFCQNCSYGNKKKQKTKKGEQGEHINSCREVENWLHPFLILVSRLFQNHFSRSLITPPEGSIKISALGLHLHYIFTFVSFVIV